MKDFYEFAGHHPWLTWALALIPYWLIRAILRVFHLWKNGWPPPHLDADGDFREPGS